MLIISGLSLKGLKPKIWDINSDYYLPELKAVMVSYADFDKMHAKRRKAMKRGLHEYLGIPKDISIYLDNGAFSFTRKGGEVPREEYEEFVQEAKPDWYPIPQDYIPTPKMTDDEQLDCLRKTMNVNQTYDSDGYVPVIHISRQLSQYLREFQSQEALMKKKGIALGGIVPNLLRAPKAMAHTDIIDQIRNVREQMSDKNFHIFGIGGTATLHIAALLGVDSVDSTGWRNRAARGIIQLPGTGERIVANLGNWRGREPTESEREMLENCPCPACQKFGMKGLKANKLFGFCNRATHNLWVLHNEVKIIKQHLLDGDYTDWYEGHLENSTYLPLIRKIVKQME